MREPSTQDIRTRRLDGPALTQIGLWNEGELTS